MYTHLKKTFDNVIQQACRHVYRPWPSECGKLKPVSLSCSQTNVFKMVDST